MGHQEKLCIALVIATGCAPAAQAPESAPSDSKQHAQAAAEVGTQPDETVAEAVAAAPEFEALLTELAVPDDFVPRVLYTWTNSTQTRLIQAEKRFITRQARDDGRRALFEQVLEARKKDPIAALLKRRELSARRFAWPHAFGTILGLGDERYGDRLLRVSLKADSFIGYLSHEATEAWTFRDMHGNVVETARVLREPERLAAVMHTWPGQAKNKSGTYEPFREFVLVNESQVEKLEMGTPAVADEIARLRKFAKALRGAVSSGALAAPVSTDVVELWTSKPNPAESTRDRYFRVLAFGSSGYRPSSELADALDRAIRELPKQETFELVPRIKFAEQVPVPPPPRKNVLKKCWGTFC